jgi:hypothetical protein
MGTILETYTIMQKVTRMAIPSFHTLPFLAMLCLVPLVIHAEVPNPSCDDAFASRILLFNESATASPIKNLLSTKDSLRIVIRRGLEKYLVPKGVAKLLFTLQSCFQSLNRSSEILRA